MHANVTVDVLTSMACVLACHHVAMFACGAWHTCDVRLVLVRINLISVKCPKWADFI